MGDSRVIGVLAAVAMGGLALGNAIRLAVRALPLGELSELRQGLASVRRGGGKWSSQEGAVSRWVQSLAIASEAERIDRLSERLAEVEVATWSIERRIAAWARVSLFSGSAACLVELSSLLATGGVSDAWKALLPFVTGAFFASGCVWIGRLAGKAAKERREAWDALSAAIVRPLSSEQRVLGKGTQDDLSPHTEGT